MIAISSERSAVDCASAPKCLCQDSCPQTKHATGMTRADHPHDVVALLRARLGGDLDDVAEVLRIRNLTDPDACRETLLAATGIAVTLAVLLARATGETPDTVLDRLQVLVTEQTDQLN